MRAIPIVDIRLNGASVKFSAESQHPEMLSNTGQSPSMHFKKSLIEANARQDRR